MKKLIILSIIFLQCACVNNFEKFYTDTGDATIFPAEEQNDADTKLYVNNFSNIDRDSTNLLSNNYLLIGYSSFYSPAVSEDDALRFGQKINADIVMLYWKHKDTITSTVPITTPTYSTVNTSYHNSYGGYGYATSTISGSQTTYYSNTTDRYDYFASYWKQNPNKLRLGIRFNPLTDEIKKQIQTNKGVLVTIVVKDTPAFANDILVGDVITKINGHDIYDDISFTSATNSIKQNSIAEFTIIRDGKTIKKKIKI